jgi:hypothetical protein
MTTTTLKPTTAEKPKAELETKPMEVDPKRVQVNDSGQAWRSVFVRLPEGATMEELRNPKFWRRNQINPQTALLERDNIFALTFDESGYGRAICTHASATEAHVIVEKVGSYRERGSNFYSDGERSVFWDGSSFGVRRNSDGIRVIPEGYTTEAAAIAALHASYPKKVG